MALLRAASSPCNEAEGGFQRYGPPRVNVRFFLVLFLTLLSGAGCRVHTLDDGPYAFTLGEILRDDCALAAGGGVVTGGTLRTEGHLVSFSLDEPELRLVGTYRSGLEEMTLDGSLSNYSRTLRGRECLVDVVTFHLDTVTTNEGAFTGAMSINYEARQPDECTCRFWFKLDAARR